MSLIKCPECGKEISSEALACPNCGFPMKKAESKEYSSRNRALYVFNIQKSYGTPIVFFILFEIMLGIILGMFFIGFIIYLIIGASIFCSLMEGFGVWAMIHDIVEYKKLNGLSGNKIEFNPLNNTLMFIDKTQVAHEIPIQNILQFDGPGTMVITYIDPLTNNRKKSTVGNTCKEDVLALRAKVKELKEKVQH